MASRSTKIGKKTIALRSKIWPDLSQDELWDRHKFDGFTTIPRTLPLVMSIIDDLTKNKPASRTYFAMWCKAFDEMYVSLQNAEDLAYQAGFTGQRAVRTWRERMQSLADLGFIKVASGPRGNLSHAVIINPHYVIRRHRNEGTPGLTEAAFNALVERAIEISAKDMEDDLPEDKPPEESAEKEKAVKKRPVEKKKSVKSLFLPQGSP